VTTPSVPVQTDHSAPVYTRRLGTERPVIKEPVWKPEIPFYFYAGGVGGASAGLALLSELGGNRLLARRAWALALAGAVVSPALLISDLGVPRRFLNMLRMFKVTSPMSVGSWILAGFSTATGVAALDAWTGLVPSPFGPAAKGTSAALGLPLTTYTAALIANTAVPVWHEARAELPVVFAAGGATSAGGAALLVTPPRAAAPALRLAVGGAAVELAAVTVMERRLGELASPYHQGPAAAVGRLAKASTLAGAALAAARARQSRAAAIGAGALLTTGAVLTRWSIFKAGSRSAAEPAASVKPQRERIERAETAGAIRVALRRPG
jgi:formate-dependent nitrite reductase membrane component NrfD